MSDEENGELSSSKLGTLDYWESAYEKEIENFEDHGDEGEIWFGIQAVRRVVNWLKTQPFDISTTSFLDIGCGNGFTCCRLAEEGFRNITGIDYSEKAVELSKSIAKAKNLQITYRRADVLDGREFEGLGQFDIGLDKGTYDAIALCPDEPKAKRYAYKAFLARVLVPRKSTFVITSCNWTRDELTAFFTCDKEFEYVEEIKPKSEQPGFSFGGKPGATTTTIVFRRV